MTTFQLRKKTSLEQKQSNILADIVTHHIQTSAVTPNAAIEEDLQQGCVRSVTGTILQAPGTTAISRILILHAQCCNYPLHRNYLRLQEIHTTVVKICLMPSVTRVTSWQSKGVTKDIRQSLDCSWQLPPLSAWSQPQ